MVAVAKEFNHFVFCRAVEPRAFATCTTLLDGDFRVQVRQVKQSAGVVGVGQLIQDRYQYQYRTYRQNSSRSSSSSSSSNSVHCCTVEYVSMYVCIYVEQQIMVKDGNTHVTDCQLLFFCIVVYLSN